MSDIYKQKAEKYKYKYLKLKQELYGGIYEANLYYLPINSISEINNKNKLVFNNSNKINEFNIKIDYPPHLDNTFENFNRFNIEGYNGRIFQYDVYKSVLSNLQIIEKLDIDKTYVQNIELACTIYYKYEIKSFRRNTNTNYFDVIFKNNNIYIQKITDYGYIIRKNKKEINTLKIYLEFINNLKDAIENFIIPLHNAGYVLNIYNVNWDGKKVYFDIEKMTQNNDKNIDINGLSKYIFNYFDNFDYNDYYYYTNIVLKKFSNKSISIYDLLFNLNSIKDLILYDTKINLCKDRDKIIMDKIDKDYQSSSNPANYNDLQVDYGMTAESKYLEFVYYYMKENKVKYFYEIEERQKINNVRLFWEEQLITLLKNNKYFSNLNNLKELKTYKV
jgi:hypothetical protein